jgi:hypothetical protein
VLSLSETLISILRKEELEVLLLLHQLLGEQVAESLKVCLSQVLVEDLGLLLPSLFLTESFAARLGTISTIIRYSTLRCVFALFVACSFLFKELLDKSFLRCRFSLVCSVHLAGSLSHSSTFQLLVLFVPSSLLQELPTSCQSLSLASLLQSEQRLHIQSLIC